MVRILGSTGSRRRRRYQLAAIFSATVVLAAFAALPAQAVVPGTSPQDNGLFQLDGNTLEGTPPPGTTTTCASPFPGTSAGDGDDWAGLFNDSTAPFCGSDAFTFVPDGVGSADHTYWSQGGSKDAYDPALGPWLWKPNDVSPDKNDLVNAFAAIYHLDGTAGDKFLYFGSDRFDTSGDAQQGFQFLQADTCLAGPVSGISAGGTAACPSGTPNQTTNAGKFVDPTTGVPVHHMNGDLLILVNFNKGGTLGLAGVFEWSGADGAGAGSYSQVLFGSGANCATVTPPDDFCSIANTAPLTTEPVWTYSRKGGGTTYGTSAFIEGGVNLAHIPGAGTCFPTFIAETRSSAGPSTGLSLQAQLKDLVFGKFQLCGSTLSTTPKDGNGDPIPAGGLSINGGSVTATDSADLNVSGVSTWSGTLKFFLCGPIPSGTCDGTTHVGLQIGSTMTVNQATSNPILSSQATLTSVGRYCWRGVFTSATPGVPNRTDSSTNECFTVVPKQPALDTLATDKDGIALAAGAQTPLGMKVYDTATLTGAATQPGTTGPSLEYPSINSPAGPAAGGSITFTLKKANCTDNATPFAGSTDTNPQSVTVTGNATYGPVSFSPDAPGTYHWIASYTPAVGDVNNLSADHNGTCNDADEDVVVQELQPNMDTNQNFVPNDSATITVGSGAGDLAGHVVFKLFVNNPTCNGTADYTSSSIDITTGTGNGLSRTVVSDNISAYGTTGTTFDWIVTYTSDNTGHKDVSSPCTNETSSITIDNGVTQPPAGP